LEQSEAAFEVFSRERHLFGEEHSPGGTWPTLQTIGMSILQFAIAPVGHVVHGNQADALEQSEAAFEVFSRERHLFGEEPSPGGTWPTLQTIGMSILQFANAS
jgi:hypothetical protein